MHIHTLAVSEPLERAAAAAGDRINGVSAERKEEREEDGARMSAGGAAASGLAEEEEEEDGARMSAGGTAASGLALAARMWGGAACGAPSRLQQTLAPGPLQVA